ncbi:toluene tolerance family protein [Parvibaculum lavamentivorans DS-1]|uniref:Toluene tolerance family protein n=1 Tax=Parvibaculum lavamentivorans (strain DS-1 / DSM 13023 / NCIMB 13966) TaxID=402881 RepID=A7HVS4_PARL1|nr:ABC transporter substrate-binding protein [Parvibaculum lavamentivorans]ABS64007.1 toluene tolerance family protein [Parvibaculum lavamentivorans DS-1]
MFTTRIALRTLVAPLAICVALMTSAAHAQASTDQAAVSFVEDVSTRAIDIISDKSASKAEREKAFQQLLNETADMQRIAAFALGQYLRTPTEEQKNEYLKLVETFIVKVYVTRLSDYNNEKLDVLSAKAKGDTQAIVQSEIKFTNGREPVKVDWWLVKNGSDFKIFDVNVVGIWLAQEQRSTFTTVIRNNGGNFEALLEHLRSQIAKAETGDISGISAAN